MSKKEQLEDSWIDRKWVEDLAWNIRQCAHVFVCAEHTVRSCEAEGIYIVDVINRGSILFYNGERIDHCSHDYELGIGNAMKNGVIVNGKNAFAHKVQDMMIKWNTKV